MTKELSAGVVSLLLLSLTTIFQPASADMIVDNSIIQFEPGKSARQDISVTNNGDKPLYIKVTPSVIRNPGTARQSREKIINPKTAGLLVSPNKLVIAPGGRKLIRFVNLDPRRDTEGIYRVTIEPVTSKLIAQETGLKVMIGYEILVLAQPRKPVPELLVERTGHNLIMVNNGNTDIYLFQGKQCPAEESGSSECANLRDRRLYPGNRWEFALPHDAPAQFQMAVGSSNSVRLIP